MIEGGCVLCTQDCIHLELRSAQTYSYVQVVAVALEHVCDYTGNINDPGRWAGGIVE